MSRFILIRRITQGLFFLFFLVVAGTANAATLSVTPSTGVYTAGQTFTARVVVNTTGAKINAAEGTVTFKPSELSVVRVSKGSVFNLWTAEPSFSNSAGTVSFSGGTPTGYTGGSGTVLSITFRTKGAGNPRVSFANGAVLAADGKGTNVLTSMSGGAYTIGAADIAPEPETVVYVAPANTPAKPIISSGTHQDPEKWYAETDAELSWSLPDDVVAVRTLLDSNSGSIPTKVYNTPIKNITLSDLDQGVQYFHLQFKNEEGWGRVNHYRLAVDTENPTSFSISLVEGADLTSPVQTLKFETEDKTSNVEKFSIRIDDAEPYSYTDETGSSTLILPPLEPGPHTLIIEAFDEAGNSIGSTFSFSILAFDRPEFTEVPSEISENVIPVIKGITRPNAKVVVTFRKVGSEANTYTLESDDMGEFVFIPEGRLSLGVYEVSAVAIDQNGAQSDASEIKRIAVQQPGYIQIGAYAVSVLSVLVPFVALSFLLLFGLWFVFSKLRRFKTGVAKETKEALAMLQTEFGILHSVLSEHAQDLAASRKNKKLTKAEAELVDTVQDALRDAQNKLKKEITDVEDIVE
jgi:hypothetical protein